MATDKGGANAGLKVSSLVAGMVTGADSIDNMARFRHGGMRRICKNAYAPSTPGSFLRTFTFGHVRAREIAEIFAVRLALNLDPWSGWPDRRLALLLGLGADRA